jgi:hypothetical protein
VDELTQVVGGDNLELGAITEDCDDAALGGEIKMPSSQDGTGVVVAPAPEPFFLEMGESGAGIEAGDKATVFDEVDPLLMDERGCDIGKTTLETPADTGLSEGSVGVGFNGKSLILDPGKNGRHRFPLTSVYESVAIAVEMFSAFLSRTGRQLGQRQSSVCVSVGGLEHVIKRGEFDAVGASISPGGPTGNNQSVAFENR